MCLLRQNAVRACLFPSQYGSQPAPSFEVILPQSWFLGVVATKKFLMKTVLMGSIWKKTRPNCVFLLWLHLGIILSLRSRLSRAASVLTRLIQPRSIDSTAGATIQWRVSAGEFDDHRELKMCKINPFSRPGGLEIILLPNKPTGLDFVAGAVFHAIKRGQTFLHFLAMWAPNIWCVYILPLILVQAYLYPRTRPINFGLWPAPSVAQKMNLVTKIRPWWACFWV